MALRTAGAAGFDFTASITTNGYFLDAETFASCIAARIGRYQISLDGDRATHDRSRKLGSGAGTFERIWANLLGMKSTSADFSVLLRLHYTIDNYEEIATFAGKVREAFGDDPRFEVYFKKIGRLGGPNDEAIKKIGARKQSEIEAYLWSAYGARPELSARETMERDYICYAARANSLMVRSTGRLGKCTVALHDDFNTIGELKPDGEIVVDQDKFQRWITPVLEQRWEHVGCPLDFVAKDALRKMAGAPGPKPRRPVRPRRRRHPAPPRPRRQHDIGAAALAGSLSQPGAAAMQFGQAAHQGEAEAGAAGLAGS